MMDFELVQFIEKLLDMETEVVEEASNALGVDVGFWRVWNTGEIIEDDLQLARDMIEWIRQKYPTLPILCVEGSSDKIDDDLTTMTTTSSSALLSKSTVQYLREYGSDDSSAILHRSLPSVMFEELARLTSNYSLHRKTKTVQYNKQQGLLLKPEDAFPDGSKDTFEDNGMVARNYYRLVAKIIEFSEIEITHCHHKVNNDVDGLLCKNDIFCILAKLYCFLTTMSSEACNQQNALGFAELLQFYSPMKEESCIDRR